MSIFGTLDTLNPQEAEFEQLNSLSGVAYNYFRVRMYGRLHFVKRLKPEYTSDPIYREALRKEFSIGYNLDHPSIVKYLKFDEYSLYQEFIEGDTLTALLNKRDERFSDPQFIEDLAIQLLDAVEYLHSNSVLHLDIKPDNIMLTRVGHRIKLIDLGCCKSAMIDTTPGYSYGYAAPEQTDSIALDAATDIYQVGCVISEMVRAFGLLPRWKRFLNKATAESPADRFQTAQEAKKAIPGYKHKRHSSYSKVLSLAIIASCVIAFVLYNINHKKDNINHEKEVSAPSSTFTAVAAPVDTLPQQTHDTVAEQKVKMLATPVAELTSLPATGYQSYAQEFGKTTLLDIVKEDMTAHVNNLFKAQLDPFIKKCANDSIRTIEESRLVEILQSLRTQVGEYTAEMASKYPSLSDEVYNIGPNLWENNYRRIGLQWKTLNPR